MQGTSNLWKEVYYDSVETECYKGIGKDTRR